MIIISTLEHNNIIVKYNNYNIYLYYAKYKTELIEIPFKLHRNNLYLCLCPCIKSYIYFDKIRNQKDYYEPIKRIKRIIYKSNFTLNKNIIYLNFYFIYTIKKYYLHKHISYFYGFINSIESYKKFNTMNLYKVVALI
jgi:hypothetical protein